MARVLYETEKYKHIALYETERTRIKFVECKENKAYDRLYFIKMGSQYCDPEKTVIYRYEDEQLIEDMKIMYGVE